jgi:uncharacterized protein
MTKSGPDAANRPPYNFVAPLAVDSMESLFREIVATRAFQRLHSIRFLGGIDYLVVRSPNGSKVRYTRYQHSLGVARLALLYANERGLSTKERRLIYISALLHDIGHAPLSHSLEPLFFEFFGIEHHRATEDLIAGRVPIGQQVYHVLKENHIDIERIIALLAGTDNSFDGLFTRPINFDTVDAIVRAQTYAKSKAILRSPERIMLSVIHRRDESDCEIADEFWNYKDQVYRTMINSRLGVLADFACQLYMRKNIGNFSADTYYTTEEEMFRKLGGLRELLVNRAFESLLAREVAESVSYSARRFVVDYSGDFFDWDDQRRYIQSKEFMSISSSKQGRLTEPFSQREIKRDLFDDDRIRALQDPL